LSFAGVDLFLVDLHGLPAERALGDGAGVGVEHDGYSAGLPEP
jgi:hypothetical protein